MSQVPRPGHDQADPGARHVLLRSDDQQEMIQPPVSPADSEAGSDQQATGCTGTDQPSSAGADDGKWIIFKRNVYISSSCVGNSLW